MLRSHTCGEINKKQIGEKIELAGWVHSRRDHGGIIFIDLRDRYGITQIKFNPEVNKEALVKAEELRKLRTILQEMTPLYELTCHQLHTGELTSEGNRILEEANKIIVLVRDSEDEEKRIWEKINFVIKRFNCQIIKKKAILQIE